MSDRPIQVGDLVIIKPKLCCDEVTSKVGTIFKVGRIFHRAGGVCSYCGAFQSGGGTLRGTEGANVGYHIERLKRIPPLEELEGERTQEDLREPA